LAQVGDEFHRLVVFFIEDLAVPFGTFQGGLILLERGVIVRQSLLLEKFHDPADLPVRDESAVNSGNLRGPRRDEEHVAGTQQGLRSQLVQDGP